MHRALIVTANCYSHYTPLQYCHVDGHLLRCTLEKWCSYDRHGVISHIKLDRTDDYATPEHLLAHIRNLAGDDSGRSPFLFYFAGHGLYDDRNQASYLLFPRSHPDDLDATALPVRLLRDTLTELGRPIVQIFDACHSGEAFRGRGDGEVAITPNIRGFVTDLRRNGQRLDQCGWEMLAACDEDEVSYEDHKLQGGVFTHALAQAIRDTPAGASVQLESLKNVVCPKVQAWAEQCGVVQHPVFAARNFGALPFAERNHLRPSPPGPTPLPASGSAEKIVHHLSLPARRDAELDLERYARTASPHASAHLRLRIQFEHHSVRFELVGGPHLTQAGRRVQPRFHIEREQSLQGGPYAWQGQLIRCRFGEHQALITFHALSGPEVELAVNVP